MNFVKRDGSCVQSEFDPIDSRLAETGGADVDEIVARLVAALQSSGVKGDRTNAFVDASASVLS